MNRVPFHRIAGETRTGGAPGIPENSGSGPIDAVTKLCEK
jgi:hypothetical protein